MATSLGVSRPFRLGKWGWTSRHGLALIPWLPWLFLYIPAPRACQRPAERPGRTEIAEILQEAGVHRMADAGVRKAVLEAMPEAAEKGLAGVTGNKRRRDYGHAAHLLATCEAIDPAPAWVAGLRGRYRRFSALQRELDGHLGGA